MKKYMRTKLKSRKLHLIVTLTHDIVLSRGTNNATCHTMDLTRDNFVLFFEK